MYIPISRFSYNLYKGSLGQPKQIHLCLGKPTNLKKMVSKINTGHYPLKSSQVLQGEI